MNALKKIADRILPPRFEHPPAPVEAENSFHTWIFSADDDVQPSQRLMRVALEATELAHRNVSLDDLDWCLERIMPANPAYLMGLPTKNDPMLGYLTTGFQDHVRLRERFGYKVEDRMWAFFQRKSSAVNGCPSDQRCPSRRVKVSSVPSSLYVHSVANPGCTVRSGASEVSESKISS